MAAKDAEMPTHHALREEVEVIAKHLSTLRKDIEDLAVSIARAGGHQAERVEDAAGEALGAIETAVRRNPTQAVGIALGIGLLVGLILRR
ncbi:MAG: YqjD family protein [Methyloceanibacter sp.]